MNRIPLAAALALAASYGALYAQVAADTLKVSFRDPTRPGTVRMHLINGGITVKGYEGRDVLITTSPRRRSEEPRAEQDGLRRIVAPNTNLTVEEENNVMRIDLNPMHRGTEVTLQVPMKTSLKLHAVNGGGITVENVQGEIEVDNTNGRVVLNNVAGTIVAHALNGSLTATVREVDPSKPMSFTSMNGKIDVTLPASLKANLNLQTGRGEIFSDFDVALAATPPKLEETTREEGRGRYRVSRSGGLIGKVNGGGQEVTFKSMNGSIYIRKGK